MKRSTFSLLVVIQNLQGENGTLHDALVKGCAIQNLKFPFICQRDNNKQQQRNSQNCAKIEKKF